MQQLLKAILFLGFLLLWTQVATAQNSNKSHTGPMNNADVVSLVSAGISDSLVAEKIRSATETAFDVSIEGMKSLKSQGVSDPVIHAMLTSASSPAGYSNSDDPTLVHQPGLYAQIAGKDGQAHMIMLEHTEATGEKTHKGAMANVSSTPVLGAYMGGPHGKAHVRASLNNPRSPIQLDDHNPSFYIYATEDTERFGGSDLSARDFVLLKFKTTSRTREVEISTVSASMASYGMAGGGSTGIDDKVRQPTSIQRIKSGIYLIKLMKPLKPGEYAFEHLLDGAFYDFGVAESH